MEKYRSRDTKNVPVFYRDFFYTLYAGTLLCDRVVPGTVFRAPHHAVLFVGVSAGAGREKPVLDFSDCKQHHFICASGSAVWGTGCKKELVEGAFDGSGTVGFH